MIYIKGYLFNLDTIKYIEPTDEGATIYFLNGGYRTFSEFSVKEFVGLVDKVNRYIDDESTKTN